MSDDLHEGGDLGRLSQQGHLHSEHRERAQEALYMGNRTDVIAEILEYRADRGASYHSVLLT